MAHKFLPLFSSMYCEYCNEVYTDEIANKPCKDSKQEDLDTTFGGRLRKDMSDEEYTNELQKIMDEYWAKEHKANVKIVKFKFPKLYKLN